MFNRCILIFPKFDNEFIIQKIRDTYDPSAKHIAPHITLVFPFESNLKTEELRAHLTTVLKNIKPFEIHLKGINPVGNYLFLELEKGKEKIIEIHKKLYSGILKEFFPEWLKDQDYHPHMTVGKIDDQSILEKAAQETKNIDNLFSTIISEVSVEIIADNEDSIIELHIPLELYT